MVLFASLALAQPTHAQIDSAIWKPLTTRSTDAGPVAVWEAQIAGMPCFRGDTVVSVPLRTLHDVSLDILGSLTWSKAGLAESRVLAKSGATIEYYQYLDIPGWTMASDRFWFLRLNQERTEQRATVRWDRMGERGGAHSAIYDEVVKAHSDAVEPTINIGGWTFTGQPTGTHVDYRICTNPGGSLPSMVQNAATKQTLPDTVADVIREAKRRAGAP